MATEISFEEREKEYKKRRFFIAHGYQEKPDTYSANHGAYGKSLPKKYK